MIMQFTTQWHLNRGRFFGFYRNFFIIAWVFWALYISLNLLGKKKVIDMQAKKTGRQNGDIDKGKAIICNRSVYPLYFLTVSPHSSFKVTMILDFPEMSQLLLWSWLNPGYGNNCLPFTLILSWFDQWIIISVTSFWCSRAIRRIPGVQPWPQEDITSGC